MFYFRPCLFGIRSSIYIVCAREQATGFMSNRGRQNVASLLALELRVDWRRGADWFETHLLDHDPASNWGIVYTRPRRRTDGRARMHARTCPTRRLAQGVSAAALLLCWSQLRTIKVMGLKLSI